MSDYTPNMPTSEVNRMRPEQIKTPVYAASNAQRRWFRRQAREVIANRKRAAR